MKETEPYIKVHDFLVDTLKLPDIPLRVFAVIFTVTSSGENKGVWGAGFIARKAHISIRSVKQGICCLTGVGLIKKIGVLPAGTFMYSTSAEECNSTSEAKAKLVQAIHRCTVFTNAPAAQSRCMRCPFGGEYGAYHIVKEYNKEQKLTVKSKNDTLSKSSRTYVEPPYVFNGSDTL